MTQPQRELPPPDPLRVLALVNELDEALGAQQFGQVMQTLLGLSFKRSGFTVIKNSVGVPDLQVNWPSGPHGFAIEVKTGGTSVSLSKRDLEGVKSTGRTPIVAAYFLSDPNPRWLMLDANSLKPGTFRRYELESTPKIDVGFEVTSTFSRVLVGTFSIAIEDPAALARLLGS